jgi:hypothetical protein
MSGRVHKNAVLVPKTAIGPDHRRTGTEKWWTGTESLRPFFSGRFWGSETPEGTVSLPALERRHPTRSLIRTGSDRVSAFLASLLLGFWLVGGPIPFASGLPWSWDTGWQVIARAVLAFLFLNSFIIHVHIIFDGSHILMSQ